MKRLAAGLALVLATLFLIAACASDDALHSSSESAGTVPGEKVPGEGVTPGAGPGTASASVPW